MIINSIIHNSFLLTLSLSPDLNVGVTLAIFRLWGNIPCWIETLKTWNRILLKLSHASIIMLLLNPSKPVDLFRFKLLNVTSNSSKFKCFLSVGNFFFASFGQTEVKKLLNFLAMSCGFCVIVLSTLISRGRRFYFVFCFPVISFITCQVRFECVLYLCNNFE